VRRVLRGQGGGPVQQRLAAQAAGDVAGLLDGRLGGLGVTATSQNSTEQTRRSAADSRPGWETGAAADGAGAASNRVVPQ
jgi:hypothetical protein